LAEQEGKAAKEKRLMETKEDLKKAIDEQKAYIAELEQQLAARDAIIGSSGEDGYLVSCANTKYSGVTAGVRFVNGRAFIPDGPGADRMAMLMRVDFGYKVERITAREFRDLETLTPTLSQGERGERTARDKAMDVAPVAAIPE
jgi:hypothetical protein